MRRTLILALALLVPLFAAANPKISGKNLSKYTIVYNAASEAEEGIDVAEHLAASIKDAFGLTLPIAESSKAVKGSKIAIGLGGEKELFDYSIKTSKGNLCIDGGGCWALEKAADILVENLSKKNIPSKFSLEGTVYGEQLFPLTEGANLRILDDNIWDYSKETIPDAWKDLPIDCRDASRWKGFAQLIRAYMPDIITLQEYAPHMHGYLYPALEEYGYKICYVPGEGQPWGHTPVFYRTETIDMEYVNYNLYTPERFSNIGSKSYVAAVFTQKASGKKFAVVSTHLWWKGEKAQPGSDYARAAQTRLIMAEGEILKAEYKCPIFVCGDMNAYEDAPAIQQFLEGGYKQCYEIATVRTDNHNGHHICAPKDGYSRESRRRSPTRKEGAIDHCLLYNGGSTEVLTFDCVMAAFTVPLTDHYPNVIDVRL